MVPFLRKKKFTPDYFSLIGTIVKVSPQRNNRQVEQKVFFTCNSILLFL